MTLKQLFTKFGITRVTQLEKLLAQASDAYYNTGKTIMSDADFDRLLEYLRQKKPTSAFLKQTRAAVTGRQKEVELPYVMPSLDKKHYGDGTFAKWLANNPGPYILMDKLDGVSIEIIGENGAWDGLYKGGDATTGLDWSRAIGTLKLPRKAPAGHSGFRAEVIMSKREFERKWGEKYKNARNLTAGIVNKQRGMHEAIGSVQPIVFDVLHKRMKPSAALAYAEKCGFTVVTHRVVQSITEAGILKYLKMREKADHLIDGIVIAVDKPFAITESNPKTMVAFKAPSEGNEAEATITAIEWRPTRLGRLHPRFTITPTKLAGVTVTHATAHTAKYIVENKINVGTVIRITRSGEVIPYVTGVVKPSRKASLPDARVVGDYEWDATKTQFKLVQRAASDTSEIKAIAHFFATGLKVDGLGEGVIKQLYEAGYTSVADICRIDAEDLMEIEGWGQKKSEKIANGIQQALKSANLVRVMAASGFFAALGETKLQKLYDYAPELFDLKRPMTKAAILNAADGAPTFQEKSLTPFVTGRAPFIQWIKKVPITFAVVKKLKVTGSMCKGHSVCFTGVRDAALGQYIMQQGGTVVNTVSAKTTHLIAKDPNASSAKLDKARAGGTKVVGLMQYKKLVGYKG